MAKKDEKKKPMSAKERYEAYLERDRKLNEMLEGITDEDLENIDMSKMSGRERYAVYSAREAQKAAQANGELIAETEEEEIPEAEEAKTVAELLAEEIPEGEEAPEGEEQTGELTPEEEAEKKHNIVKSSGSSVGTDEDMMKRAMLRRIIFSIVFALAAISLQLLTIHVKGTPGSIDFSALPELFAAITYGPLTGVIIVLVKNIAYILIQRDALGTALANVICDTIFVVIASVLYRKNVFMKPKKKRGLTRQQVRMRINTARFVNAVGGGAVGGIVASAVSFFTFNYITLPIIFRKYPPEEFTQSLLEQYQAGLNAVNRHLPAPFAGRITEITSIMQASLIFNVEITLLKYALVTAATAIIYPFVSDFLHYRR